MPILIATFRPTLEGLFTLRHALLLSACIFLPTLSARAAENAAPGLAAGTYLQATLGLVFIVALLLAAAWAARKVSGGKAFGQGQLKVVSGIALGPKERIVLVEVEDQWLVIGIVPGQIRTLHRLPRGSAPNDAQQPIAPFARWLQTLQERRSDAS